MGYWAPEILHKPCRGLWVDCQPEATDKAGITGVSSKSLFKIHVIRPYVNATYINTQQCVLICRLDKACKNSKPDTSAGWFLKYLGPYTQNPLQKPGGTSVREVITMLWYCFFFVTKHEDITTFNGSCPSFYCRDSFHYDWDVYNLPLRAHSAN